MQHEDSYETAVQALGETLRSAEKELAVRVRRFFSDAPEKLVRVVYYPVAASQEGKVEGQVRFKPTQLLLDLSAAARANDIDKIGTLERELFIGFGG